MPEVTARHEHWQEQSLRVGQNNLSADDLVKMAAAEKDQTLYAENIREIEQTLADDRTCTTLELPSKLMKELQKTMSPERYGL